MPRKKKLAPIMQRIYGSYSFVDKDPVIDAIRTLVGQDSHDIKKVCETSGVAETTLFAWFFGVTKSPRNSTVEAILRAMGYERTIIQSSTGSFVMKVRAQEKKKARASAEIIPLSKAKKKEKFRDTL